MTRVAIVRCDSYEDNEVKKAVRQGLTLLGDGVAFCNTGEKILLKPNLLAPALAEQCVTTHPAVFKALAEAFLEKGAIVSFGDSPALGSPTNAARKCGILELANELNIGLADFVGGERVSFPEGHQNKSFVIAQGVLDADGIVSICKMKTHGLTIMTGAIKNQFGCIPGMLKGEFHVKLPDPEQFSTMLVDLNRLLRPRLFVMDGIIAMEGNGPRGGNPRPMNVLLFATDPVALDVIACRLMGIQADTILTIKQGGLLGLGEADFAKIELVGDPLESLIADSFAAGRPNRMLNMGSKRLRNSMVPRPVITDPSCIGCGICVQMCPVRPGAVFFKEETKQGRIPQYSYDRCIRCYCCQEMCPEGAIRLETPLLGRVLNRLGPQSRK